MFNTKLSIRPCLTMFCPVWPCLTQLNLFNNLQPYLIICLTVKLYISYFDRLKVYDFNHVNTTYKCWNVSKKTKHIWTWLNKNCVKHGWTKFCLTHMVKHHSSLFCLSMVDTNLSICVQPCLTQFDPACHCLTCSTIANHICITV